MENIELIKLAENAMKNSYSVYSHHSVGCAVLCGDGRVFCGCNVESVSYSPSICAERVAIYSAISSGANDIQRIAIVSSADMPSYPCGVCRQVMIEHCPDAIVIVKNGDVYEQHKVSSLLPYAFTTDNMRRDI